MDQFKKTLIAQASVPGAGSPKAQIEDKKDRQFDAPTPKEKIDMDHLQKKLQEVSDIGKDDPDKAIDELLLYEKQKRNAAKKIGKLLPKSSRKELQGKLKSIMEQDPKNGEVDPRDLYGGKDNQYGTQEYRDYRDKQAKAAQAADGILNMTGGGWFRGDPISNHPKFPPFLIAIFVLAVILIAMDRWVRKYIMGFGMRLFIRVFILGFGYVMFTLLGQIIIGLAFDDWQSKIVPK